MNRFFSLGVVLLGIATVALHSRELPSPEGSFVKEQAVVEQTVRVVFYRVDGNAKNIPTVKIDDRVVGSLLPGHYTQTKACVGMIRAGVANRWAVVDTTRYLDPIEADTKADIYFQVHETIDGHFSLTRTDTATAHHDLSSLELGSNVINRYVPKCSAPKAVEPVEVALVEVALVEVAPVVMEPTKPTLFRTINLGADALFPFDSSNFKSAGRTKLDAFVHDLQSNNLHIQTLRISGHTDRLGSDNYNMNLSQQRAQRVADYLKSKGIVISMEVIGRGETQPVTQGCNGSRKQVRLTECLQPDRRVSIDLIGYETPSIEVK